jgi:hypothetical protein
MIEATRDFKRALAYAFSDAADDFGAPAFDKQKVLIGVCGDHVPTRTFCGVGNTLDTAFKNAREQCLTYLKNRDITPTWFCMSAVEEERKIDLSALSDVLTAEENNADGFSFDEFYQYAFLKQDTGGFSLFTDGGRSLNFDGMARFLPGNAVKDAVAGLSSGKFAQITLFRCRSLCRVCRPVDDQTGEWRHLADDFPGESTNVRDLTKQYDLAFLSLALPYRNKRDIFARKLSLLREIVFSGVDVRLPFGNAVVFLSVSDALREALVFCGKGKNLRAAWNDAANKADIYVKSAALSVVWLKADVLTEREKVSYKDFLDELSKRTVGNVGAYAYPYGVSFDDNFETAVLSGEFNGRGIWDYKKDVRDFKQANLTRHFVKKGVVLKDLPRRFVKFKTMGFLADENDEVFKLRYDDDDYGRRIIDFTQETVAGLIRGSTEFLLRNQKEDGSFVYGYINANQDTLTNYNIVRHAGSALTIMQCEDLFGGGLGGAIERANAFLIKQIRYRGESAFVTDKDEIKLGGNGIAVVSLASYGEFLGSNPYTDIIRSLANGILEMQEPDGSYYHVLNAADFSRKERSRIIYYDGEATYALAKAFALLGEEKYLAAAEKAVRCFIDNNYETFRDHWVAYSLNEVTKYVHKQEYFDFALKNAQVNLDAIFNRRTPYHTYFELLMATFNTFKRLQNLCDAGDEFRVPDFFEELDFARTIWKRAVYMQNSYFYPEFSMYMKNPLKIAYAFNVRHQNWRVRIDDIQHFMGGYCEFYKHFNELAGYTGKYGLSDKGLTAFLAEFF